MSRMSRKCGSLDVSQPYVHLGPVTGLALPFSFKGNGAMSLLQQRISSVTHRILHRIRVERPRCLTFIYYCILCFWIICGNSYILVVAALVNSKYYKHLPPSYIRQAFGGFWVGCSNVTFTGIWEISPPRFETLRFDVSKVDVMFAPRLREWLPWMSGFLIFLTLEINVPKVHEIKIEIILWPYQSLGQAVVLLRHYATNRDVAGSILDELYLFNLYNPSIRTMVLCSTQPLTKMSTLEGKERPVGA
jgi:hypothetical protein